MTNEEKAMTQFKNTFCVNCGDKQDCDISLVDCTVYDTFYKQAYLDGLAAGGEETKAEWHDCFLSCSSPYCAGHFRAVKMQGELGNMAKWE